MSDLTCVALVTRFADARVAESASLLARHLAARGLEVLALEDEVERLPHVPVRFVTTEELIQRAHLVVAIGGDGTLLQAAGIVSERDIPLLGVNRGRLGFLTDVSPKDMLASVDAALAGECARDVRPLLDAELIDLEGRRSRGLALNDIVVQTSKTGHLIDYDTWIDDRFINSHGGDGLVIASSTGSTAYALSCGGPIVEPGLEVLVLAPICPHTLSDRPIVVSARSVIEVRLSDRPDSNADIVCDGRPLGKLEPGSRLFVRSAAKKITLLHPIGYDYFRLLRSKLNWGRRSFDSQN
jgi:NAD+ kinase